LLEGRSIKVTIERNNNGPPEQIDAELVDISPGGVKLSVSTCPGMQEAVVLKFAAPELDLDLTVDAQVCWARPASDDDWHLGCALNPRLPERLITDLAMNGYVQRRRDPRLPIDLSADMRCEGSIEPLSVRLLDYSTGGFRVEASGSAAIGQRVLLRFDDSDESRLVVARTMWHLQTATGHEIGCTFVNRDGHRIFRDIIRSREKPSVVKPIADAVRSHWPLLIVAALTGITIFRYFFLP
jgi:hypothetical protein